MLVEKKLEVERQKALMQENGLGRAEEPTSDPEMQPDQAARFAVDEEEDRAENEQLEKQAPLLSQKSMASSREKRESRRQRGLEHNKLQNKHVSFAFEGQPGAPNKEGTSTHDVAEGESYNPGRYEAGDAISSEPLPKRAEEEGAKMTGENPLTLNGNAPVSSLSLGLKQEEAANMANANGLGRPENPKIRASQSFTCPERPSELSLNLQNNLASSKSFRSSTNKSKQGAPKDLGSPSSFPIQRYQDDPDKLRDKRERWKGKRQLAGRDEMHSQSLEERGERAQSPSPLVR